VIIYNHRQLLLEAAISLAYCYGVYLVSISRFNIYPKYVLMYIPRYLGGGADTPYAFITLGQSDLIDLHMIYMSAPNVETDDHALIFSLQQGILMSMTFWSSLSPTYGVSLQQLST
jgi:hypothetical protein